MASTTLSSLKLIIERGPRKGETLEFNPRSTIRIGRVVRGNNVAIKDQGISSKHLCIKFNSNSCKWEITDLDSSNGTILNSSQLKPLSPFELNNGDEVKIGELTSIRVEIIEINEEIQNPRNRKRQDATKSSVNLGVLKDKLVDEDCSSLVRVRDLEGDDVNHGVEDELEWENENEISRGRGRGRGRRGRGRGGRGKKANILEDVNDGHIEGGSLGVRENVENVKRGGVSTRRTRSSKREESELMGGVEEIPTRRTRSAKNVEKVMASSLLEKVPESEALGVDNGNEVENKKTRGGRGKKKKVEVECLENARDVVLEDKEVSREVSELEVGTSSLLKKISETEALVVDNDNEGGDLKMVENEKTRGGHGKKDEVEVECLENARDVDEPDKVSREVLQLEVGVPNVGVKPVEEPADDGADQNVVGDKMAKDAGQLPCEETMDDSAQQNESMVGPSQHEQGTCEGLERDSVLGDRKVDDLEEGEFSKGSKSDDRGREDSDVAIDMPDLEKMTVREWFDYLEVYWPKKIYAKREEVIADIRKTAQRVKEYIAEQQEMRVK